jgi:hypothetical protein
MSAGGFAAGQAPAVGLLQTLAAVGFAAGQAPAVGSIADECLLLVRCGASPRCWVYCRRVSAVGFAVGSLRWASPRCWVYCRRVSAVGFAVGSLRGKPPLLGLLQTSVCCGFAVGSLRGKPPLLGLLQTLVASICCWFTAGQVPAVGSIADECLLWVRHQTSPHCWVLTACRTVALGIIASQ